MTDIFTKEKRSEIMSKIRSVSELERVFCRAVSKSLYPLGYRYRRNYKKVAGRPDIAFVSKKLAVFVDGDFWHGYRFKERRKKLPKKYWVPKIEENMRRDRRNRRALRAAGWDFIRLWEHEVRKKPAECIRKIVERLEARGV